MKKTLFLAIFGMALMLAPRPASAAYLSGKDLLAACTSEQPQKTLVCVNYVAGVVDYHVMMQSLGTTPTTDFCLPEGMPIEAAAVAVARYLKKSPQHEGFIAAPAVTMALHQAYPCGVGAKMKKKALQNVR